MKSIVVGTVEYQELMKPFGEVTHYHSGLLDNLSDYDVMMFTGGADVNPYRYGQQRHPKTVYNPSRDYFEFDLYKMAKNAGLKFIGICRGAQLLCVNNGDKLIQHTTGHNARIHNILTRDDKIVEVNGDHHQMMKCNKGELIAWAVDVSNTYEDGNSRQDPYFDRNGYILEPEAAWYKESKSLCIQWHPEWSLKGSDSRNYFNQLVEEYIVDDKVA